MQTITVSEQGQVVIPIEIRKQLGAGERHLAEFDVGSYAER